jgi:glycosyltransferase involved in cell wall biosynthesis
VLFADPLALRFTLRCPLLYICIPAYNEAPTIGLVLWKIRKVFQDYAREYELIVYNDGSTDATAETLTGYESVLPLTVLGGDSRVGYAQALEGLFRAASQRTRYARRDAVITLQGDLTDPPELIPELVRRFEGGADVVVGQWRRDQAAEPPLPVRRMRRVAPWALRPFVRTPGVDDPFGSFRLYRVSVLRDALKSLGSAPLVGAAGWASNVDVLLATLPHARRIETIDVDPRFDLRHRESRIRPWSDAIALLRYGRSARGRAAKLLTATP